MQPPHLLRRTAGVAGWLIAAAGAWIAPRTIAAQGALREPVAWRFVGEAGASVGGTWLEGPRAPTVSSKTGFLFGLGLQRGWTEFVAAGATLRAGIQPLELHENGDAWSGGTLTEANFVGTLSLQSRQRRTHRISLDLSGGAAVLTGASDIVPFNSAASLAPLAEVGVAIRRGATNAGASRRDLALFARYSALKLKAEYVHAVTTSGWVGRVVAGVRVTR